ncbi:hypothetical protein PbJCM13498_30070 [Prolixibacter bellariivorans]|uniref:DUF4097 domain-containing protein n=1 Tax=Prolixibacter bellariivorans TaxID=314319 RepID=A0A5M4B248_9BACT|nr:DUF4097 family beta strand repeat-containing protein [Prolixibacter bellariivorans]GET34144.1 hypothetical protein PbJCM13498_30070 [Prolixibacter bellariivorans]
MKSQIRIKRYTLIALMATLLSCNGFAQKGTPTITKTFDMNQPGTLNSQSSGGGIVVEGNDQNKVVVQAFVRKNGKILSPTDPLLTDVMKDFNLDIKKNGSVITANVERKRNFKFWNNVGISLKITVPKKMSCNVSSSGGGLKISNVDGTTHDLSSSGGGIRLENVAGTTKASSSGGGVQAINQNGDVRLSSSGGGVTLDEGHGSVYARSSGGGVRLKNVHGDVDASSSGGGVTVTGETEAIRATSSGGSVHVNISNLSKKLYLASSGGGVDATIQNGDKLGMDLDLKSDRVHIELHNFSGTSEKDRVKGTMNGGGIPVYMHASGGNVNVKFQD